MNYGTGAIKDEADSRDLKYEQSFGVVLPVNYNVLDEFPVKVENQNGSGSCCGQAWAKYMEVLEKAENKNFTDFSAKSIYSQIRLPQGGAYIREGAKSAVKYGVNKESSVPSYENGQPPSEAWMSDLNWMTMPLAAEAQVFASKEYRSIEHYGNIDIIKEAIYLNKGVVSGFIVSYEGWKNGEVRPPKDEETKSGHCVFLVGWENQKILFLNSWGDWGYAGIGKVDPAYWSNPANTFSLWTLVDKKNNQMEHIKIENDQYIVIPEIRFAYSISRPEILFKLQQNGLGNNPIDKTIDYIVDYVIIKGSIEQDIKEMFNIK